MKNIENIILIMYTDKFWKRFCNWKKTVWRHKINADIDFFPSKTLIWDLEKVWKWHELLPNNVCILILYIYFQLARPWFPAACQPPLWRVPFSVSSHTTRLTNIPNSTPSTLTTSLVILESKCLKPEKCNARSLLYSRSGEEGEGGSIWPQFVHIGSKQDLKNSKQGQFFSYAWCLSEDSISQIYDSLSRTLFFKWTLVFSFPINQWFNNKYKCIPLWRKTYWCNIIFCDCINPW